MHFILSFKVMYLNAWRWSVRRQHAVCMWTKLIKCVMVDGSTFISLNARFCLFFGSHSPDQEIIRLFGTRSSPFVQNTTIDLIVSHLPQALNFPYLAFYLQFSPLTWTILTAMGVYCYIYPWVLHVPPILSLSVSYIFITSSPTGVYLWLSWSCKIKFHIY
jgi:hypothetical protein